MKLEANYYFELLRLRKFIKANIINMEELKKDAEEFLNNKYSDIGTFYVDIETCDIYLTPLGYVTKKTFYSTPFRSRDRKVLIKVGKLIPELPAIIIYMSIRKEFL